MFILQVNSLRQENIQHVANFGTYFTMFCQFSLDLLLPQRTYEFHLKALISSYLEHEMVLRASYSILSNGIQLFSLDWVW